MSSMNTKTNTSISQFADVTNNVSLSVAVIIILIIVFVISPIKNIYIVSTLGILFTMLLIGIIVYYNLEQTKRISNTYNINLTSNSWDILQYNIVFSYALSIFLIILFFFIGSHL